MLKAVIIALSQVYSHIITQDNHWLIPKPEVEGHCQGDVVEEYYCWLRDVYGACQGQLLCLLIHPQQSVAVRLPSFSLYTSTFSFYSSSLYTSTFSFYSSLYTSTFFLLLLPIYFYFFLLLLHFSFTFSFYSSFIIITVSCSGPTFENGCLGRPRPPISNFGLFISKDVPFGGIPSHGQHSRREGPDWSVC